MTDRVEGPVSLYSLATWINGFAFKSINFSGAGMPVIKISEVKNGLTGQTKFTDGSYDSKFLVEPGAMIFCWSGQPETSIGTFYWRGPRGWLNQHLFKVIPDPERVHPDYFYFLMQDLKSLFVQLARNKQTTGLGHVTKQDLIRSEVTLPPLDEQRRIAEVLGALDDLIDANERLISHAAELRRSLLDVDFGVATEQHALSSIARFVNGKNFTKGADGAGRPIIRTPEVRDGVKSSTVRSSVEATDDFISRPGDLLFVWSGSLCLGRWVEDEALVNQHVFKVIPNAGIPDWYVYACLEWKLPRFLGLAADKATTMGHIQRAHLDTPVPKLGGAELEQLDSRVRPLWELELELSRENQHLRRTRDELLPLLMSGAVRVRPEGVAA